jgi:hypothetical protein
LLCFSFVCFFLFWFCVFDLGDRKISEAQAHDFAARHELDYLEMSAKDGTGIEDAFVRLATQITAKVKCGEISTEAVPLPETSNLQAVRDQSARAREENMGCCSPLKTKEGSFSWPPGWTRDRSPR